LWLSAPDLALTQLMVETVTTVLLLLGLRWLPPRIEAGAASPRAAGVAAPLARPGGGDGGGLGMAALTYAVLVHPASDTIADFFLQNALTGGGGSNVVNVLLVDFRSFDTLGEITVLAIVALTVYALLRRFRPAPESVPSRPSSATTWTRPARRRRPSRRAAAICWWPGYLRLLLPFMGVVAVYFFMRGHNLPGGGFVAGLIFSVAILVQYMLAGTVWVESHLQLRPHRWLGFGLVLACATGLGAWLFGHPSSPPTPRMSIGHWWASCTCPAPSCSISGCSWWWSARPC
jgi:multicomponent K+:H+ antiporter subunit A